MYYGKRKGIIITIVIIVLVLLLALGGVFAYLYTDLFKSNETLFFKYIDQTAKSMTYNENIQMQNLENTKQEMLYNVNGKLNFDYEGEENQNLEKLKQLELNINSNVNNLDEKSYTKATLVYENQDLFNLEYANSNNIYALKSDEIVTAFVGVRNENLKVFAQKLGIADTTQIPDSIPQVNYEELLNITEEEKTHIYNTYMPVIIENISEDNYTKQAGIPITKEGVEYNTTSYRLDLSSEEVANVLTKVLETLKQDSITLNLITTKAKLLNLSEEYTQINNFTQVLQEKINEINNMSKSPEDGISVIVYAEKGQTVLTEVIIKNQAKITMYGSNENLNNKVYMIVENLSAEEDYTTMNLEIITTQTESNSNVQVLINKDDEVGIELYMDVSGTAANGSILSNYELVYNEGENKLIANYEQEIEFVEENEIIELDNTNCAILNDYPTEQLGMLLQLITSQTVNVFNQKIGQVGVNFTNNQQEDTQINQVNNENAQGNINTENAENTENTQI